MSEAMTIDQLSVPYNPNLLVTYKVINNYETSEPETKYQTDKVTDLEWQLHNGRTTENSLQSLRSTINTLEDQIAEWYDPNYTKEEVLSAIIEHFGFNPTKEIEVQGTINFSGVVRIPYSEVEDFDLSSVTVDAELSSYDYDADFTVDDVSLEDIY